MWARTATLIFCAAAALAQENARPGFLHGELLGWTGTPSAGQFTFRMRDQMYSCTFDQNTYFELDNQRITLARAEPGDRFELVSDEQPGTHLCYARTFHIIDSPIQYVAPGIRPRPRRAPAQPLGGSFVTHPSVWLSGVVIAIASDSLTVRTRSGHQDIVRLRSDTCYMAGGEIASIGGLRMNTIVLVRGGRNPDGEVQADQVIWGEILQPQ